MKRSEVYKAIDSERDYQVERWGVEADDSLHTVPAWLTFMRYHLSLAEQAATVSTDMTYVLEEIRKITTLGVSCMECHGVQQRIFEKDLGSEQINGFWVRFTRVHPDNYIMGTFSFSQDEVKRYKLEDANDLNSGIKAAKQIIGDRKSMFS